jgi:hypothetical protein
VSERPLQGWEPELPSSDSWLLAAARNHARFYAEMAEASGWRLPDDPGLVGGASGMGSPFANLTVLTAPATEPEGAAGVQAARRLATTARAPVLVVSPWPTPDLATDGLVPVGHPPLMLRPAGGPVPDPPPGLEIQRVSTAAGVAEFERTVIAGYPIAELADAPDGALFGPGLLDTGWALFCGRVDGVAVCTAAGHVSDGIQVVEIVSTLAEHRGTGYGEAVTWAATTLDPDLPAVLVASDLGRPIYARMGYQALCRFTFWVATPA